MKNKSFDISPRLTHGHKENREISQSRQIKPMLHQQSANEPQRLDESAKPQNVNEGGSKAALGSDRKMNENLAASPVQFDSVEKKSIKHIFGWVNDGDNFHITRKPNVEGLDPCYYSIVETHQGYYLQKKQLFLDELYKLPDDNVQKVIDDLETFWGSKEKYKEYGITYKRGILLPGPPGTGKSSLLNFLIHRITNQYKGIVLDFSYGIADVLKQIRLMETETPILVIMEDVDAILDSYSNSTILNLLDGNNQVDNVVYLATTNYPERIEPRIKNRPSRFDRVIEIGMPTDEVRRFFLENKLKESDKQIHDIDQWVRDTDGLTLSHLKELIISVVVMGGDYNTTLSILKSMMTVD